MRLTHSHPRLFRHTQHRPRLDPCGPDSNRDLFHAMQARDFRDAGVIRPSHVKAPPRLLVSARRNPAANPVSKACPTFCLVRAARRQP